ncbi:MAG: FAD-dependent oxidoreductase [Ideonella sp.]
MSRPFVAYPFSPQRHPATLPSLVDGVDAQHHPVVVIGGGPVGYVTALGLAQHGVRVVLLEADDSVCSGSRAICISRRSLQIAQRLGAGDGFMAIGLPWTGGRSFYRDTEVFRFSMPQDIDQKLPPMVNLAQYHIEQILLDRALQSPELIDIRWQTRVTAIEPLSNGARLAVSTPDGDYTLKADWVVAADGGRSLVRDALGLKLQGTTYEGRYVIVDILLDSDRATERLAFFDPPCNPGSTVLVHKQPDRVWRIDYQLRDDEDADEAVRPENVMPRVESLLQMMGEHGAWSPIWITVYKANALSLERYRHGRVLFAGDAAHLVPIFGVRGANSGIDDADNLAWKLAFVIKGLAGDELLDSYSDERVAAAHENLTQATKSTEFMAPPSFAFELMRRAVLSLAVKHPGLSSLINPRQTSAITYTQSPLNLHDDSDEFDAGPGLGAVFAESALTIVENGSMQPGHLGDLLGPHFTALLFTESGQIDWSFVDLERACRADGVPLRLIALSAKVSDSSRARQSAFDHTGRLFPLYGATPGTIYLLRPDGHVLARWRKPQAQTLRRAIDRTLQRLGVPSLEETVDAPQ